MLLSVKSFIKSSTRNQYYATIVVNIITIAHGCIIGWTSPTIPYLRSDETHIISGPVTSEQASWIGSFNLLGSLISIFFLGFFREKFGEKKSLLLLVIPSLISWVLIFFSTQVWHLYVARLIAGLTGGGLLLIIPIFTGKIAETHVRGALGSYFPLAIIFGNLLMFILGGYLKFHIPPLIVLSLPTIFFITMIFLPETPHFYLSRDENEKALKSLMFYRNCEVKNDLILDELETFRKSVQNVEKEKIKVKDFIEKENRRGLLMSFFLVSIGGFSGNVVILTYTADIFISSGSSLSPNESSIIVGLIQLIGVYIATITTDRFGRKLLMTISCGGSFLFLFIMATYDFMIDHEIIENSVAVNWIPIVSLSMAVFVMSLGIASIPLMMVSELVPHKIRQVSMMIFMGVLILFSFVNLKIFPPMLDLVHLYGIMLFYSIICLFATFISIFLLPETRGKKLFDNSG